MNLLKKVEYFGLPLVVLIASVPLAAYVGGWTFDLIWWLLPLSTIAYGVYIAKVKGRWMAWALVALAALWTLPYELTRYNVGEYVITSTTSQNFSKTYPFDAGGPRDVDLIFTRSEDQFRNEDTGVLDWKWNTVDVANRAENAARDNIAATTNAGTAVSTWIISAGVRSHIMTWFPNAVSITHGFPWFWAAYFAFLNTVFALPFYIALWASEKLRPKIQKAAA